VHDVSLNDVTREGSAMGRGVRFVGWRVGRYVAGAFVVAAIASVSGVLVAQSPESKPVELPSGPAKTGFDISRFSNAGNGWFDTFYVKDTEPLRDVLRAGRVAGDTRLLVANTVGGRVAFVTDQMAYHHIAQGSAGGRDWLVSF
jgi:hypothetical protein